MKFRIALAAATVLAAPLAVNAQPVTGLYVGGGAGVNIMHDENAHVDAPGVTRGTHLKTRVGPAVSLAVGYGLGNGIRAEVEGSFRYNNFGGSSGTSNSGGL